MKKFLSIAAVAALCMSVFTACDDDDFTPQPQPVYVTDGVFVVNEGASYSLIDGSLTYVASDGKVTPHAFSTVNGRSLGGTPNDAVVSGDRLYIVVTDENTVEVIDRNTLKSIKQLNTVELMGQEKGTKPRCVVAGGKYIFVSTYAGYVARIDTDDYSTTVYQAGSYPEGMGLADGKLYVANSDYGSGVNPSVSIIDLADGTSRNVTDPAILNPVKLAAVGGGMYILDSGTYATGSQTEAGVRKFVDGKVEKIIDATLMAVDEQRGLIYTVNAPYSYTVTPAQYNVYDMKTGENRQFVAGDEIDSPVEIAVDPESGDVYVTSLKNSPDTGYPDYNADGYMVRYSSGGIFKARYDTGVNPGTIVFNSTVTYE